MNRSVPLPQDCMLRLEEKGQKFRPKGVGFLNNTPPEGPNNLGKLDFSNSHIVI